MAASSKKEKIFPLLKSFLYSIASMERRKSDGKLVTEMVTEMEFFFELHFVEDQNPKLHVFVNDIINSFLKNRNRMSALELNVARLHATRIFKRVWPNAVYAKYKNKRCFKFVRFKYDWIGPEA